MRDDLWQALEAVRDDPEVAAVVLAGAGEAGLLRRGRPHGIRGSAVAGRCTAGALRARRVGAVAVAARANRGCAPRLRAGRGPGDGPAVRPAHRKRGRRVLPPGGGTGDGPRCGWEPDPPPHRRTSLGPGPAGQRPPHRRRGGAPAGPGPPRRASRAALVRRPRCWRKVSRVRLDL